MNDRPSSAEQRLAAWLAEGPTSGPDDLLVSAQARARSTRQRPAWWPISRGDPMETTWRARPLDAGRLAFIVLTTVLAIAVAAAAIVVGARFNLWPDRGLQAIPPAIPEGPGALFAFTSWSSDASAGDVFVVRADGSDGRRITSDPLDDWSPAWSPDGGRIAFYSGDSDSVQLRVVGADGTPKMLADAPGCWNPTSQAPAWSPDGRFVAYVADRDPDDETCDLAFTDVYVVASDGTGQPHRLLADSDTRFSASPAWHGDQIAFRANAGSDAALLVARITDADQPWGLEGVAVAGSESNDPVALGWPRWSPNGDAIATTLPNPGAYSMASVLPLDESGAAALWSGPEDDVIVPDWSPDGSWLSVLVLRQILADYAIYRVALVQRDGSKPTFLDVPDLSGNAGPAMISPDGTRLLVRVARGPMPGDILVVNVDGGVESTIQAGQWSSLDWQPVVNDANPWSTAEEGLPAF
jgi:Tol biopolymer transport system component